MMRGRVMRSVFGILAAVLAVTAWTVLSAVAQPAKPLKAAFVLPGLINDGSFNTQAYNGILAVQKDLGVKATHVEKVDTPSAPKVIRDYAAEGYDVVYAHSGTYVNAVLQVAPDFPKTTFAVLAGRGVKAPANVWVSGNEFEDAYFLAGALAGRMTKTNTVGYVGGVRIPIYAAAARSFEAGVKHTNPSAKVLTAFTGNFNDPTLGKQAATAQIENGADIVASALNLGAFGLFEAARTRKGVWVIGKDTDQKPVAPDVVLTSVILDWQLVMQHILKRVAAGEKGGYVPLNVKEGTAYLAPFYGQVPNAVVAQLDALKQDVVAGRIKYPTEADLK